MTSPGVVNEVRDSPEEKKTQRLVYRVHSLLPC